MRRGRIAIAEEEAGKIGVQQKFGDPMQTPVKSDGRL